MAEEDPKAKPESINEELRRKEGEQDRLRAEKAAEEEAEGWQLAPEQVDIIKKAVVRVLEGRLPACPVCQKPFWTVDGFANIALAPVPRKVVLGGKLLPVVPFTCTTCGNTILMNLKQLGIFDQLLAEDESNSEAAGEEPDNE